MNFQENIFGAYDIRGKYPQEINETLATSIGNALGKLWSNQKVILGYDARHGSIELAKALEEALLKHNINLEKAGLITTPMLYFLVNHYHAAGGIMITASHNPKEWNGMKIVKEMGMPVSGTEIKELLQK